jgi:branched-chain amino acid transport system permease protein
VYGSLFALMSVSLTLTYITTKVPNFAQGALVTAGLYTGFALFSINKINPYESLPVSFLVGGLIAIGIYLLVLRPLSKRGAPIISLMIATLAVDIIFVGIFGIYSDYLYQVKEVYDAKLFYALTGADFTLFGVNGVAYAAPAALALTTIILYLVLTRTRFGLAMRATVENSNLAKVIGINTEVVYVTSWFVAGGVAAIAGVFYSFWLGGEPDIGSILLISMFAGSILGGLKSIYGAVLGGLVVGGSEIIVTTLGAQYVGAWVTAYEPGIPLLVMVITLLVLPGGMTSLDWRRLLSRGRK